MHLNNISFWVIIIVFKLLIKLKTIIFRIKAYETSVFEFRVIWSLLKSVYK